MNLPDSPDATASRRIRRFNIGISAVILIAGLGLASPLGFWDQATRKVLAERCFYSFEATDDMSSDRLGEVLDECADDLEWGDLETFTKVLDRLTSGAWFYLAVVTALAMTHVRIARTRSTRTLGERLADRVKATQQVKGDQT